MQSLIRSKSAGVTGGRGTAGAGPGRDLLYYPNPIQHLARVLGNADSRAHIQELQDRLQIPIYHSALRPAKVPAHLQKGRIPLSREQLPFLTRVARWLARKHIHVPEERTPVARATTPPRRTGNTSRNAPSIQAGTC